MAAWYYRLVPSVAIAVLTFHPAQARADDLSWLPAQAQVEAAMKTQPVVNTAAARWTRRLPRKAPPFETGSHEFELSSGLQRRNVTNEARRFTTDGNPAQPCCSPQPNKARLIGRSATAPAGCGRYAPWKMPSTKWQGDCWKSGPDGCAVSSWLTRCKRRKSCLFVSGKQWPAAWPGRCRKWDADVLQAERAMLAVRLWRRATQRGSNGGDRIPRH